MKVIEEQLARFMEKSNTRILGLKGEWGSGKTHFWREFYESNKENLTFNAYSYVSLFGLSSIAQIKNQILANMEILQDDWSLPKNGLKKVAKVLDRATFKGFKGSVLSEYIEDKMINHFLICIDDLERKEDTISTSSILGLLSNLVENKKCRVLLIYNDAGLEKESKKQLEEYREKVIDAEISFKPSLQRNIKIVWNQQAPLDIELVFKEFDVNNIRIMRRVKEALNYFHESIELKYNYLWDEFQRAIIVLSICYQKYQHEEDIENISTPLRVNKVYDVRKDEDPEPKEHVLYEHFRNLGFHMGEHDEIITFYLKHGYVDLNKYSDLIDSREEYNKKRLLEIEHREIWEQYRSDMTLSQKDFIKSLSLFMTKNWESFSLPSMFFNIDFITNLDGEELLPTLRTQLLKKYVETTDFREVGYDSLKERIPVVMREELAQLYSSYGLATKMPIEEAMAKINSHENSWNPSDMIYVKDTTVEEFKNWIINTPDSLRISRLFKEHFIDHTTPIGYEQEAENFIVALEELKLHSPMDKKRIENIVFKRE